MRRKQLNWLARWLPFLLTLLVGIAEAQTSNDTRLQIRLRGSDGTAVVGETVILERLPEAAPISPDCKTDINGECIWHVNRGLYQVLFTRPLDDISTLAVAEGGLLGFGITVGEEDIIYHFTFHSDGRVYFDAAPEAVVPSPIIPVGEALHGGTAPTPVLPTIGDEPVGETPTPEATNTSDTAARTTPRSSWHFILFIGGGLMVGGSLHLWSRQRRGRGEVSPAPQHPISPSSPQENTHA
jgi:hypothetical protein